MNKFIFLLFSLLPLASSFSASFEEVFTSLGKILPKDGRYKCFDKDYSLRIEHYEHPVLKFKALSLYISHPQGSTFGLVPQHEGLSSSPTEILAYDSIHDPLNNEVTYVNISAIYHPWQETFLRAKRAFQYISVKKIKPTLFDIKISNSLFEERGDPHALPDLNDIIPDGPLKLFKDRNKSEHSCRVILL